MVRELFKHSPAGTRVDIRILHIAYEMGRLTVVCEELQTDLESVLQFVSECRERLPNCVLACSSSYSSQWPHINELYEVCDSVTVLLRLILNQLFTGTILTKTALGIAERRKAFLYEK